MVWAEDFFGGVTEDALGAVVPGGDGSGAVGGDHGVAGEGDDGGEACVFERGSVEVGEVAGEGEDGSDFAAVVGLGDDPGLAVGARLGEVAGALSDESLAGASGCDDALFPALDGGLARAELGWAATGDGP